MKYKIDKNIYKLSFEILRQKKSLKQWSEIESSDMFQGENYCGGFDSTEQEFCFSLFLDKKEFWFQISIEDIRNITLNKKKYLDIEFIKNI